MNAQINRFNASRTDEAEEEYKKFEDLLKQYEETNKLMAEERQKQIELEYQLADLRLEKIEYTVQLKIDVSEDTRKYLDFLMELSGDGLDVAADNIDRLSQKIGTNLDDIKAWEEGLDSLFSDKGYEGSIVADLLSGEVTPDQLAEQYDLTQAEADLVREYAGNIMDATLELQNLRKEITDQMITALEDMNEQFDKQIEKIDRISGLMDHYGKVIELVGADVLGVSDEMLKSFDDAKMANSLAKLAAARTKYEANERELAKLRAEREKMEREGATEEALKEMDRAIEEA